MFIRQKKNKKEFNRGFTLLEIMLVIALIGILAVILIFTINPARRLSEAHNAQRKVDVAAIVNAIYQYAIDNNGSLPAGIPEGSDNTCTEGTHEICRTTGPACGNIDLSVLTDNQLYMTAMPIDPSGLGYYNDYGTGYLIVKSTNGRVTVCAPRTELLAEPISITR